MGTLTWTFVVGAVTLLLTFILIKVYYYVKWLRRIISAASKLPGPKPHWFFGNVLQIKSFSTFMFQNHHDYIEKGEKLYVFWLFWFLPIIVLGHPDSAKVVMKSNAPKTMTGPGYPFLVPWLGHSLLISNGAKWERNRRLLTPAFHFSILTSYFKVYNEVADTLLDKLAGQCKDGGYIDIFKPASMATLDTLLQCSLGYKDNIQNIGDQHPYVTAVNRLGFLIHDRTFYFHQYSDFIYKYLTAAGREFYRLCDYVHKFSVDIISKRRKELEKNDDIKSRRHLDFLDILLTAKDDKGEGLTDDEIRSEVDTFLFAGHDTTSSVLSWSVYCLGRYKNIQEKVYDEVESVMGEKQYIDSEDIHKMKYLTCFLKEVMRQHTPVPLTNRTIDEDLVLGGHKVAANSMVDLGIYHIHNNPAVWDRPEEFRPDRFLDDKHHEMDPFSFTPFSAGPRNCIGMNFAQNEEKVLIARLVRRFDISLDPDHIVIPHAEVVMRTETGIMVNFKERQT